ncbi:hypothetical protein [Streptomyces sp. NPDC002187]|uniref:hypothetical protein n=1 Tax=Streptomyces sp. NPDC002187 TaxID=3364637 RepID=UPI0036CF0979
MAWDEWEQLKADAAARQHGSHMQLNSTGGGTSDTPSLKSNAQLKRGAIKALQEIRPKVDKVGIHADDNTDAAEREFKGWATGAGLKDAHEEWALQVKNLQARLAGDQAALAETTKVFYAVDHGVRSSLAQIDTPPRDPRREA